MAAPVEKECDAGIATTARNASLAIAPSGASAAPASPPASPAPPTVYNVAAVVGKPSTSACPSARRQASPASSPASSAAAHDGVRAHAMPPAMRPASAPLQPLGSSCPAARPAFTARAIALMWLAASRTLSIGGSLNMDVVEGGSDAAVGSQSRKAEASSARTKETRISMLRKHGSAPSRII
eukprot:4039585-Pleurochrysis_carterae.AAC.1